MKIITNLCLISLLVQPAFAEPTPAGTPATYTNENGSFTYYYQNGDPVPAGTRTFISAIGVAFVVNPDGSSGDPIFATKADASAAANAKPDCSGAVFGAGPDGIPAGCPGSSRTSPSGSSAAVDEKAYEKASFELNAILFSANEIGAKSCVPAGTKMPGSLSGWTTAFKSYITGEAARDKKLDTAVETIQQKIQNMSANTSAKNVQADGIQLQIEMVNASIESLNGEGGRIPLREKLLVAALASLDENGKENIKTMEAYKKMVNESFVNSLNQAQAACERKKKVKTCETDEEGNETCTEKEEKDPVPGCEVALAQIPAMKTGPAQKYGETYLTASFPSTAMNNHMEMFENEMTNIMASIPRSNDANYDWSTPMEEGLKAMKLARKDSGTKCAAADDAAGKDKISKATTGFLSSLGLNEETSPKVAETFSDVWTATDNVIGQASYRGEYFTLVGKKINALLVMDRSKLQTLLATKSKLENYQESLKNQLSATGAGGAAKSSTTTSTAGNTAPARLSVAAQSTTATNAAIAPTGNKVNFAANDQDQKAAVTGSVVNSNTKVSSSNIPSATSISGTKLGSTNNWSGLSLGSASMALAKKNLDSIAKNDKKLSTMVSTTSDTGVTGSSSGSSKGGANKTKAAGTLFTVVNNDSGSDSVSGAMEKSFAALSKTPGAEEVYKTASYGSSFGGDNSGSYSGRSSGSYSRTSSSSTSYSRPTAATVKSSTTTSTTLSKPAARVGGGVAGASSAEPSSDARLVSQSIVAKKFKKKDAYAAAENDSLFQRVTKAYIRNYEKVEEPSAASAEEAANP